jgi:hypothetical protein
MVGEKISGRPNQLFINLKEMLDEYKKLFH